MSAELLQALGWLLSSIGLCLFISSTETAPVFEKQPEEIPEKPMEDPRLEVIRRWQSQGVLNDAGELWWASAARAERRNPADDVNPPRIPPKRGRM